MPLSNELRAIFIHIPKNAGTSVVKALNMKEGEGHVAWRRYEAADPLLYKAYFKFAIVRNPWERVVSNYLYSKMLQSYWHSPDGTKGFGVHPDYERLKTSSFQQCVESIPLLRHPGWLPQSHWICRGSGQIMLDFLCKYENLVQDFADVSRILGVNRVLSHVNPSEGKHTDWKDFYDPATEKIVRQHYAIDIERFGYNFA